MTNAAATLTTTTVHVRVGHSGRAIHAAVQTTGDGRTTRYTRCGAERRHAGVGATFVVDAPITCRACSSAPAPATVVATPAPRPATTPARSDMWDGLGRRGWLLRRAEQLEADGQLELAAAARADADQA